MKHRHTVDCYARNATGALAYTPCREDGLDKNLKNLNPADFEEGHRQGLTLVCVEGEFMSKLGIPYAPHQRDKASTFVICPKCKKKIRLTYMKDFESFANTEYAQHWAKEHADEEAAP